MGPQDYISSGGSEETVSLPFPASRVACISCPMAPSSNFKTCSLISSLWIQFPSSHFLNINVLTLLLLSFKDLCDYMGPYLVNTGSSPTFWDPSCNHVCKLFLSWKKTDPLFFSHPLQGWEHRSHHHLLFSLLWCQEHSEWLWFSC